MASAVPLTSRDTTPPCLARIASLEYHAAAGARAAFLVCAPRGGMTTARARSAIRTPCDAHVRPPERTFPLRADPLHLFRPDEPASVRGRLTADHSQSAFRCRLWASTREQRTPNSLQRAPNRAHRASTRQDSASTWGDRALIRSDCASNRTYCPLAPSDRSPILRIARRIGAIGRRTTPIGRRVADTGRRITHIARRVIETRRRTTPSAGRIPLVGRRRVSITRRTFPIGRRIPRIGHRTLPIGRRHFPSCVGHF